MSWFDNLLSPIMWVVAWIMTAFHSLFTAIGLNPDGGAAWSFSIIGLVIVMRIALIPLFFRQIKASRGMQLIQPELQAIQKKYKGKSDPASREAMSRETMELYRKHNTNPFASCLPILLQSPIFFALFRVLNSLKPLSEGTYPKTHIGPLTQELATSAEHAEIFGAPLSGTFMHANGNIHIQIVSIVLILAMSVTTFTTQRQLTMKNMPKAALEGPIAQQQKVLLYVMPLIFAFSGVNFPIGVLIYWTVTNLWSMGQQFYTIRRMPAPGSEAERLFKERQARKKAQQGSEVATDGAKPTIEEKPRPGQRQQPVRKDRQKPRPTTPAAGASRAGAAMSAVPVSDDGEDDDPDDAPASSGAVTKPAAGSNGVGAGGSTSNPPAKKKRNGPSTGSAGTSK
jgi:YidC/Oxa1 family membrane protein insertase